MTTLTAIEKGLKPHRLEDLLAWLKKQDPNEEFRFLNADTCLLTQYEMSVGTSRKVARHYEWLNSGNKNMALAYYALVQYSINCRNKELKKGTRCPQTFGGALKFLSNEKNLKR